MISWIRPGVIVLLTVAFVVGFFVRFIPADVFVPFATGLIVFWFKDRSEQK